MSDSESREVDLIKDPGLPAHVHRRTDTDPVAAKRAERQVAILFSLSALGTLLLIYSFIFVSDETFFFIPVMGSTNAHQLGIGLGMAIVKKIADEHQFEISVKSEKGIGTEVTLWF